MSNGTDTLILNKMEISTLHAFSCSPSKEGLKLTGASLVLGGLEMVRAVQPSVCCCSKADFASLLSVSSFAFVSGGVYSLIV